MTTLADQAAEDQAVAEFRTLMKVLEARLLICLDTAGVLANRAGELAPNTERGEYIAGDVFDLFWRRALDVCWPLDSESDDDSGELAAWFQSFMEDDD